MPLILYGHLFSSYTQKVLIARALLTQPRAASPHDELVYFINEDVAAIRTQRFKYVVRSHYRTFLGDLDGANRTDWAVLVDMEKDPEESYDVSSLHPDVLADLQARLTRARATFDPLRTPTPPPAPPR